MKKAVSAILFLFILYVPTCFAQSQVKGTVRDEKGPLPGVNILVKNSTRGTQTDASGNFSIQASKGETLVFSSTGFVSQETVVDERTNYSLTLSPDVQSMENVVVIGY